ncbi:YceI-like domain protein [compost metagenome]
MEGEKYDLKITGDMTVKGMPKEVMFTGQAVLDQGTLMLEASTIVTFTDFGMTNPHTIIMETENDITVELRLMLKSAQSQ